MLSGGSLLCDGETGMGWASSGFSLALKKAWCLDFLSALTLFCPHLGVSLRQHEPDWY
jgi:hypothetical protein